MNFKEVTLRSVDMFLEERAIHELMTSQTYNSNEKDSFNKSLLAVNYWSQGLEKKLIH